MSQPTLSRTPSTNTITQSRAFDQHVSGRNSGLRPRQKDDIHGTGRLGSFHLKLQEDVLRVSGQDSLIHPTSSASSSSLSNSGHDDLATRSQLFKRPPRFKSEPSRELLTYTETVYGSDEGTRKTNTNIPFAKSPARRQTQGHFYGAKRQSPVIEECQNGQSNRLCNNQPNDISTVAPQPASIYGTNSSTISSANEPTNSGLRGTDPPILKRHADVARISLGKNGPKIEKEGSEGTPSMGSSFSDIDGT